jgi:hypothetical protein
MEEYMYFDVHSLMKNPRITPVSIAANGTLIIPNNAVTVNKTGTGVYVVTLKSSCQHDLFAYATCHVSSGRHIPQIAKADITPNSVTVRTYDTSNELADAPFDLFLIGSDGGLSIFGVRPCKVRCGLGSPKFIPIVYDGDTESQEKVTANYGTVTKTATGRYTLALTRAVFLNSVYCIVCTDNPDILVEITEKTNKGLKFELTDVSGTPAAADAKIYAFLIGTQNRGIFNIRRQVMQSPHPYLMINPFEYLGSGGTPAIIRGNAYISGAKIGTGDYDMTYAKQYRFSGWGFAQGGESAIVTAVADFTSSKFTVLSDADGRIYGLDIGFRRGVPPA